MTDYPKLVSNKVEENTLFRSLNDNGYRESADKKIDEIVELMDRGYDSRTIVNKLGKRFGKEISFLIEIAKSRIQTRGKFSRNNRLWLDQYTARYSTPELVSEYRARRITGNTVFDIGSGGGMQAIFFSKTNSVTGVERNRIRFLESKINAKVYEAHNLELINSEWNPDEIGEERLDNAVIFSDPLRESAAMERELHDLVPSPEAIIQKYSRITGKFVFDIPPQTRRTRLDIDAETEYISVNGSLNRLTLYCGELKHADSSAVMLPGEVRVEGSYKRPEFELTDTPLELIELPDPSLIYAGLVNEVKSLGEFRILGEDGRRILLTSSSIPHGRFPGKVYRKLMVAGKLDLAESLRSIGAGKIYPRFALQPEESYAMKNELEKNSAGEKPVYIFKVKQGYALCEPVENSLSQFSNEQTI